MASQYLDLIHQTFDWPVYDFDLDADRLTFHGLDLYEVAKQYGTPLRINYVPKIGQQIQKARNIFTKAINKNGYKGSYTFCYCTKSSHFPFVLKEIFENGSHIETSSAYDMKLLEWLAEDGRLKPQHYIICNGFKPENYIKKVAEFINRGFHNTMPVLDNLDELGNYFSHTDQPFNIGLRIAAEEEPKFEFYTSRLGIRAKDIVPYYNEQIRDNPKVKLRMLHFFINTGITDTAYYWSELDKCISTYCDLKKVCPDLEILDIGGGFPVPNSLYMDYDYQYMADEIIKNIKEKCEEENVEPPHIFTEFGSFTVAESGATIFSVLNEKQQNDAEKWYMIDGSLITHLPDTWGTGQRFILLPLNKWTNPYQRINIGGLTCDSMDYYNSEVHQNQVFLPQNLGEKEDLLIGFFYTGAYQDTLGGIGGLQHCLVPSPRHLLIDKNENDELTYELFREEQGPESMLKRMRYY